MSLCPSCHGSHTVLVAEHYQAQVRLAETDPEAIAPLAPPLRRSILSGTLCITLFWMAVLSPGFVDPKRGLMVAFTFGLGGLVSLIFWLRARKADRLRMGQYQAARLCLDCQHLY